MEEDVVQDSLGQGRQETESGIKGMDLNCKCANQIVSPITLTSPLSSQTYASKIEGDGVKNKGVGILIQR